MSEENILRPEFEPNPRYDQLLRDLVEYQVEEDLDLGKKQTHHFADGLHLGEITHSDLDMFDRIVHFPNRGDISLEEFIEARKAVEAVGNESRNVLWAFLANKMMGVITHGFKKEKGLDERLEDK